MKRRDFSLFLPLLLAGCGGDVEYQIQSSPALRASKNVFGSGVYQRWTPTIRADTMGDLSVAYAKQKGDAIRIGNITFAGCSVQFTPTFTTASGNIEIHGAPWLGETDNETNLGMADSDISLTAGRTYYFVAVSISANERFFLFKEGGGSAASLPIQFSALTSGNQYSIRFLATYFATPFI